MYSHLTRKKCPLCFRLSSGLNELLRRFFGIGLDCRSINQTSDEKRVAEINSAAPDCACENYRTSKYSLGVVEDTEQLALFIFLPMLQIDKSGNAKPNVFSHVHSKGRSIQRDDLASAKELTTFVTNFLNAGSNRIWKGVLVGQCRDVRNIKDTSSTNRAVCVYDTAERLNPAHAELCQTQHISEADGPELRGALFEVFGKGKIRAPLEFRGGTIWKALPQQLQARS